MARSIAFYTSGDCYGGLEKNVLHFIQWLGNSDNQISLLTVSVSQLEKAAEEKNIPYSSLEKPRYYIDLRAARSLSRFLKEKHISLLFIIRPRDILLAGMVKTIYYRKLKLVYFQQSFLNLKKHSILYSLLFQPFDAWIAPSVGLGNKVLSLSRYKPSKLLIVPPCIDAEYYAHDTLTKNAARKILNLPQDKIILGVYGRYDHNKKLDFFIRAIQFLKRHKYKIDLLIMGKSTIGDEEEYQEFLGDLACECNVENQVHFRPYSEKLVTFFRSLDIFATNWIPKPYDVIIPKLMASGAVVVAPFSEINTELLDNGNFGLLYQRNDLEDFSAKIIHLITQPKLRYHLIENGRKLVFDKYDKQAGCEKVNNLITKLLE